MLMSVKKRLTFLAVEIQNKGQLRLKLHIIVVYVDYIG